MNQFVVHQSPWRVEDSGIARDLDLVQTQLFSRQGVGVDRPPAAGLKQGRIHDSLDLWFGQRCHFLPVPEEGHQERDSQVGSGQQCDESLY